MAATNINTDVKSKLAVMSWNARSIKLNDSPKAYELQNFVSNCQENIDVICIKETMYSPKDSN